MSRFEKAIVQESPGGQPECLVPTTHEKDILGLFAYNDPNDEPLARRVRYASELIPDEAWFEVTGANRIPGVAATLRLPSTDIRLMIFVGIQDLGLAKTCQLNAYFCHVDYPGSLEHSFITSSCTRQYIDAAEFAEIQERFETAATWPTQEANRVKSVRIMSELVERALAAGAVNREPKED